jgi:hypothetical protein
MTLEDRLPGSHVTARNCPMAKRKVPRPDGGAAKPCLPHGGDMRLVRGPAALMHWGVNFTKLYLEHEDLYVQ